MSDAKYLQRFLGVHPDFPKKVFFVPTLAEGMGLTFEPVSPLGHQFPGYLPNFQRPGRFRSPGQQLLKPPDLPYDTQPRGRQTRRHRCP